VYVNLLYYNEFIKKYIKEPDNLSGVYYITRRKLFNNIISISTRKRPNILIVKTEIYGLLYDIDRYRRIQFVKLLIIFSEERNSCENSSLSTHKLSYKFIVI
jgi:hypothetical protein